MLSFPMRSRGARATVRGPAGEPAGEAARAARAGSHAGTRAIAGRDGWYSSSLELMDGLEVTEDVPLDALPTDWTDPFADR